MSKSQLLFLEKHSVIALAPLLIDRFSYNSTKIFSATISLTSLHSSILGPSPRSQMRFLGKTLS